MLSVRCEKLPLSVALDAKRPERVAPLRDFTCFVHKLRADCLHRCTEYGIIKINIDVLFIAEQPRWEAHFCIIIFES